MSLGHVSLRIFRGFRVIKLYTCHFAMREVIVCEAPGSRITLFHSCWCPLTWQLKSPARNSCNAARQMIDRLQFAIYSFVRSVNRPNTNRRREMKPENRRQDITHLTLLSADHHFGSVLIEMSVLDWLLLYCTTKNVSWLDSAKTIYLFFSSFIDAVSICDIW